MHGNMNINFTHISDIKNQFMWPSYVFLTMWPKIVSASCWRLSWRSPAALCASKNSSSLLASDGVSSSTWGWRYYALTNHHTTIQRHIRADVDLSNTTVRQQHYCQTATLLSDFGPYKTLFVCRNIYGRQGRRSGQQRIEVCEGDHQVSTINYTFLVS